MSENIPENILKNWKFLFFKWIVLLDSQESIVKEQEIISAIDAF